MLDLAKLSTHVAQQVRSSLLTCPVEGSRHKVQQRFAVQDGYLTVTITFQMLYDVRCHVGYARKDYEMRVDDLCTALSYSPRDCEARIFYEYCIDDDAPRSFSSTVTMTMGEPSDASSSSESSSTAEC